jgi:hypothetical protein
VHLENGVGEHHSLFRRDGIRVRLLDSF